MKVAACCAYFRDSLVEPLVRDLARWGVDIHLWALESALPAVSPFTRGAGLLGKFLALNRLLPHAAGADLVLFVDDDVRLGPGFVPEYASIVEAIGASIAQPALAAGSHFSHDITLERKGRWARLTNFVEVGPVFSMTRDFLARVAPFPEANPMGWGLEAQWSVTARSHGLRMAIVDACPVRHDFRPVGARYATADADRDMLRFFAENGLSWPSPSVGREFVIIPDSREDYLRAFPAPLGAIDRDAIGGEGSNLRLLWALATLVRPELIVEIGGRRSAVTRVFEQAAAQWGGRVAAAFADCGPHPVTSRGTAPGDDGLGEAWSGPAGLMSFAAGSPGAERMSRWLDFWVEPSLAEGGVAIFHGAVGSGPGATALSGWLRRRPPIWRWQGFDATDGAGFLWRMGDSPDFESNPTLSSMIDAREALLS